MLLSKWVQMTELGFNKAENKEHKGFLHFCIFVFLYFCISFKEIFGDTPVLLSKWVQMTELGFNRAENKKHLAFLYFCIFEFLYICYSVFLYVVQRDFW